MDIRIATEDTAWDDFVRAQPWTPFLQSWTMGNVYEDIGQVPIRLEARDATGIRAVCFGHVVSARRGKHLSIPYGPLIDASLQGDERKNAVRELFAVLRAEAKKAGCCFLRVSPFYTEEEGTLLLASLGKTVSSPLHLLAEHVWCLDLRNRTEENLRADMRKTTRNLIGRAERDGVTIVASDDPEKDLPHFTKLHNETRKRHKFTPYGDGFFKAQTKRFAQRKECTLYLARYQGEVIAASIHMHAFGETSYHHGASSSAHQKIPASYLLQWTAIQDALRRGDRVYNFWGIAPLGSDGTIADKRHPFGGVTLFKTGFGGNVHDLMHCFDIPLSSSYWLTHWFERYRKWRRGF